MPKGSDLLLFVDIDLRVEREKCDVLEKATLDLLFAWKMNE
jgi:hypothetical protein